MQNCIGEGGIAVPVYKRCITFCISTSELGVSSASPDIAHRPGFIPAKLRHLSEASKLEAYLMLPSCLIGEKQAPLEGISAHLGSG